MTEEQSFDWFFGPVAYKNDPEIASLFMKQYKPNGTIYSRRGAEPDPEKHSGSHYFPIIEALFNKKRVISVEVPFVYPEEQKGNEMSPEKINEFVTRRQRDADAYRLEAIHLLAYLNPDPRISSKSKIREVKAEKV